MIPREAGPSRGGNTENTEYGGQEFWRLCAGMVREEQILGELMRRLTGKAEV